MVMELMNRVGGCSGGGEFWRADPAEFGGEAAFATPIRAMPAPRMGEDDDEDGFDDEGDGFDDDEEYDGDEGFEEDDEDFLEDDDEEDEEGAGKDDDEEEDEEF